MADLALSPSAKRILINVNQNTSFPGLSAPAPRTTHLTQNNMGTFWAYTIWTLPASHLSSSPTFPSRLISLLAASHMYQACARTRLRAFALTIPSKENALPYTFLHFCHSELKTSLLLKGALSDPI